MDSKYNVIMPWVMRVEPERMENCSGDLEAIELSDKERIQKHARYIYDKYMAMVTKKDDYKIKGVAEVGEEKPKEYQRYKPFGCSHPTVMRLEQSIDHVLTKCNLDGSSLAFFDGENDFFSINPQFNHHSKVPTYVGFFDGKTKEVCFPNVKENSISRFGLFDVTFKKAPEGDFIINYYHVCPFTGKPLERN